MENFKFYTDHTPLTPDEIHSHKNFNKVLEQYKNVPVNFYKTGWFKAGLATVTVVATGLTLFFATGPNKNENSDKIAKTVTSQSPYADETPCVKSPTPNLDVPLVNFTVNTSRDTVLKYETGSVILYKANSLKDDKGNNVSGNVVIHYREFHNPIEVFASGIPMQYDSAGSDWHLKSAGMIELTATQNGKPVFVDLKNPINVQMKSDKLDGDYNVYFLDTANRNWAFEGVDNLLATNNEQRSTKNDKYTPEEIANMKNKAKAKVDEVKIKKEMASLLPVKPKQVSPGSFTFMLDILQSEFPELSIYGKTKFEVLDKNKSFNNQIYSTEWEDASLKEIVRGEEYAITLTRGNISKSFNAMPVLEGKDLAAAIDAYNKKFKEYEVKLAARLKEEKDKIEAEKQNLVAWEKEASEKHAMRIKDYTLNNFVDGNTMARFTSDNSNRSLVTRAFTVSKFGIWNCDKPNDGPGGPKLMATFVDEMGDPISMSQAYLCEKGTNMMYTFIPSQFNKFCFDKKEKNVVWGILNDGKLAYGLEETFAAENIKGREMRLKMTVVNDKITNLKQVKELFGI